MIPLALTAPLAYEANPGIVEGVAPKGTTAVRVRADGRSVRVLRLKSGKRAFLLGPIGLPPRDITVTVEALAGKRVLASTTVDHVFGLPAAAATVAPPRTINARVQARLATLPARTGVSSAAWVRDLGNGSTAAYNAGARYPAASTIKLAILLGVLARDDADPLQLVGVDARAGARAELLQRRGERAAPARRRRRGRGRRRGSVARRDRDVHLLRLPARARRARLFGARAHRRAPLPPTTVVDQPDVPVLQVHDRARPRHAARLAHARRLRSRPGAAARASRRARRASRCGC